MVILTKKYQYRFIGYWRNTITENMAGNTVEYNSSPEVFQLNLAGLQEHIGRGKEGILPPKPLKVRTHLTNVPHVLVVCVC
jgi:hypothetical protein